jgi:SAM-dependent methyltransferase
MTVRRALVRFSGKLQRIVTPGNRYSQSAYEDVLRRHVPGTRRWLDLGCGHAILPAWRGDAERTLVESAGEIVGIDYDLDSLRRHRSITARCRGDASRLPFANEAFDLVTANMVVEHLADPPNSLREIRRVLRPGGLLIFHTPNAWGYPVMMARLLPYGVKRRIAFLLDGRDEEDVFPTHYRANTEGRIQELAAATGFAVRRLDLVTTSPILHVIPPLLLLELLWIRTLMGPRFRTLRSNIIAVLERV